MPDNAEVPVRVRVPVSYNIMPGYAGEYETLFLVLDLRDPETGETERVLTVWDSADARAIGSGLRKTAEGIQTINGQHKESDDSGN